jgi:hypothetical protein
MLQNLILKVTYLHSYIMLEQIVVLLVDPGLDLVFAPRLAIGLKILTLV